VPCDEQIGAFWST